MCLILFALDADPHYRLVIAANRDEYHVRPSAPAGFWPDAPGIYGGRDLERGGSWFALQSDGRLALVTNVREPGEPLRSPRSRGLLVSDFLRGQKSPEEYLQGLAPQAGDWQGFNLLVGAGGNLCYWSNRGGAWQRLPAGCYGLSNAGLDTPWPKVRKGRYGLASALAAAEGEQDLVRRLLSLLSDRQPAPDEELPETGVGRDWERMLAPLFIVSPEYGTRASTLFLVDRGGEALMVERRFDASGDMTGESWHRCRLQPPVSS